MNMRPLQCALCVLAMLMAMVRAPLGQNAAERLTIVSPGNGEYVSGRTLIQARVEPAPGAESVLFFVDGRQVCVVRRPPFDCEWDAGRVIEQHQIRVAATFVNGVRLVSNIRTKDVAFAETANVDVVQVTATVTDRGHYVKNLPQSAFHVSEDGRPQTISHFQAHDVPLDVVVALDISGSMTLALPKLKQAAKDFVGAVSSKDRVSVLGFNDSIFTLAHGATDPAERVQGIDQLAPWGATAMYDVIFTAVDTLGQGSGRKALIVFTDGEDEGSHASLDDVVQRLQTSDVTLYMIAQGRGTSLEPLKKVMRRLSESTGGRALFTEKIDQLHDAFTELLDELSNQYLLGYVPTNTKRDSTLRRITVQVDGYSAVRAREAYRMIATPE
jgi:Ca-activated chloride channel family protein